MKKTMYMAVVATMAVIQPMRPAAIIAAAMLGLGLAAARAFSSPQ